MQSVPYSPSVDEQVWATWSALYRARQEARLQLTTPSAAHYDIIAAEAGADDDDGDIDYVADDVPRAPLVYVRGQTGSGKTFLARELIRGKHGPVRRKNIDPDVIKYADEAAVFHLTFNSRFSINPTEGTKLVTKGGAYLPLWLRLLYIELARFKKLPWSDFLDDAVEAFEAGQLSEVVVGREVRDMLNARRGRAGAPLVVIVDELVQCGENLPSGFYTPKNTSADDAYRSELCRLMDNCGGVVGTTTVSQAFINAECRSSPRALKPGAVLRPLDDGVSRGIITTGVDALYGKGMEFNDAGEVVPAGAGLGLGTPQLENLVDSLVCVTGGHPRLVCGLASCLSLASLEPPTNFKLLVSEAMYSLSLSRTGYPALGTSEEFTEAVLRDLLLGTTRRFFDVVEYQRVLPGGDVEDKLVPRVGDGPAAGYNYDEIALNTPVSLVSLSSTTSVNPQAALFLPPAVLFKLMPSRKPLPRLQGLVFDIFLSHNALLWTSFESCQVSYDRALSLARFLASDEYNSATFASLYRSRSSSCFIGSSRLLRDVTIDASAYRERIVSNVKLDAVLRMAQDPARRQEVLHTLYVLKDGTWGIDAISFYACVRDCEPYKKGQLIAEAKQYKYSLDASKTILSCAVVSDGWGKTSEAFKEKWSSWRNRIVFVVVARRKRSVPSSLPAAPAPKDGEGVTTGANTDEGAGTSPVDDDVNEYPSYEWSSQAIVLGRDDLYELCGPVFGDLINASEYWFKASGRTSFSAVFVQAKQ